MHKDSRIQANLYHFRLSYAGSNNKPIYNEMTNSVIHTGSQTIGILLRHCSMFSQLLLILALLVPANGFVKIITKARCQDLRILEASTLSPGPSATRSEEAQFESWAKKAGIEASNLTHALFKDKNSKEYPPTRGLKVISRSNGSSPLVIMPRGATLSVGPKDKSPFQTWVPDDVWNEKPWYARLALKLLWERELGDKSTISGYIKLLPKLGTFDTLIHWEDGQLLPLRYPSLVESAKRQRYAWSEMHMKLRNGCPEGAGNISRDYFIWAMECVLSRAFSGSFGFDSLTTIGMVGVAIGGGVISITTMEPWGLVAASLLLLPFTLPELMSMFNTEAATAAAGDMLKSAGTSIDHVLLPFIDSMNHDSSCPTDLKFSPLQRSFSLTVKREFAAGDQAFISYGPKTNDELIQFYGFVEQNNPHDEFVFELDGRKKLRLGRNRNIIECEGVEADEIPALCATALEHMSLSAEEEAMLATSGRVALALRFRQEKVRLLKEALAK